jgi:uncharacterized membrane protein
MADKYKFTTIDFPGSHDNPNILASSPVLSDINNAGQVIGDYHSIAVVNGTTRGPTSYHGFLYSDGTYTALDFVPNGINDAGQIVGGNVAVVTRSS